MLSAIEEYTGRPVSELFNYMAGTSTGRLLVSALGLSKTPLTELRRIYFQLAQELFAGAHNVRPYSQKPLQALIARIFPPKARLTQYRTDHCKVIILAVDVTTTHPNLFAFRNYSLHSASDEGYQADDNKDNTIINHHVSGSDTATIEAALLSTSAAPTYFNSYFDSETWREFVDGGLLANNPTLPALTELTALEQQTGKKLKLLLSLGTSCAESAKKHNYNPRVHQFPQLDYIRLKF